MHQRTGSHTKWVPAPTPTSEASTPGQAGNRAVRVLEVSGEIDLANRELFQEAISQAVGSEPPGGVVVLDFTRLTFIDSSGVYVLIDACRESGQRHVTLRIAAASEPVARVLRITALDSRIALFPSVERACSPPSDL